MIQLLICCWIVRVYTSNQPSACPSQEIWGLSDCRNSLFLFPALPRLAKVLCLLSVPVLHGLCTRWQTSSPSLLSKLAKSRLVFKVLLLSTVTVSPSVILMRKLFVSINRLLSSLHLSPGSWVCVNSLLPSLSSFERQGQAVLKRPSGQ